MPVHGQLRCPDSTTIQKHMGDEHHRSRLFPWNDKSKLSQGRPHAFVGRCADPMSYEGTLSLP